MSRPVDLHTIADKRREEEARTIRADLFRACRAAVDQLEGDLAGFALVAWDREGHLRSSYNAAQGPIRAPLVPTLAADALNRHVAVMLAAQRADDDDKDG
jgi:hypothetical protein